MGYSSWDHKELDMTERTRIYLDTSVCVSLCRLVYDGFYFVLFAPFGPFLYFFTQTEIVLLLLCRLNIHRPYYIALLLGRALPWWFSHLSVL